MINTESLKPKIGVIDYGMGNLSSVLQALKRGGAETVIVRSPSDIRTIQGLLFPGVGALKDCITALKQQKLDQVIRDWIENDKPFLGVCLGLQALFEYSEEGKVKGLGVFSGKVKRFNITSDFKVPHMGWNTVSFLKQLPLNKDFKMDESFFFYFVHSYYAYPEDETLIWSQTDYGVPFTSGIARGNCFATQFHPEKSQANGLQLYTNFIALIRENKFS